jgi:capsular polysaccharide biosynthesis protein
MNPSQRPDSYESANYFGMLRRRWWIVLALTCLGLIVAFGYAIVAPKSYTATAAVNVTPVAGSSGTQVANGRTGPAQVNLDTEAQVVASTQVATIAAHLLHSPLTPWRLAQQISVTVPPNSSVLDISCTASTATAAAACANDFAKAYLQNRSATAIAGVKAQMRTLEGRQAALQRAIFSLSAKIGTLPKNSSQALTAKTERTADATQLHSVNGAIGALNGQLAQSSGGSVITAASPPGKPSSPKKVLLLASGLVAGLLLGLIVASVVDRRDKSVHSPQDVERYLDVPVLLNVPPEAFGHDVFVAPPGSRIGQAFTELAHAVSAALGEGNHIVLVAGTTQRDRGVGRSLIAANLAATLARMHSEVVLVCADMNGTAVPDLLGIGDAGEGLAELFAGTAAVRDVARAPAAIPGLWVIGPGADPSRAIYNLRHDTAQALTSQLRRDARYVVIELQATDDGADSLVLGEFADGALVTVEIARADRIVAADCVRRLRQLRAPVLGAVTLPALSGRVRAPRLGQSARVGPGLDEPGHDRAAAGGRIPRDVPGLPPMDGMPERRDRPERTRNGQGKRADRISGG